MSARLALVALYLFTVPAGSDEGRRANALFGEGEYEEAAALYRAGLEANEETAGAVRAGLLNNLGCALYELEQYAEAQSAFEQALAAAVEPEDLARAAYNAGTAAARQQQLSAALAFYRRALLARPGFRDAAFNYEYIKRRLQEGAPPAPEPVEPSPFARELKAQADRLVAARRYADALATLEDGLRADSTVGAYQDYIARLRTVTEIDASAE